MESNNTISKDNILLSIIIPVYNVADYIHQCLESVLKQVDKNMEIILVDDGSSDGLCPQICDEYASKYSSLIKCIHQGNGGLGAARNTGIENAKGEYLFFIDSDDFIKDNALKIISNEINKSHADMIIFTYDIFMDDTKQSQKMDYYYPYNGVFTLKDNPNLILDNPSAWARVSKKCLFSKGLRFPSNVWYEDLSTTIKALIECNSIVMLNDSLYSYRQRPGSITRNSNLSRNLEIIEALEDVRHYLEVVDMDNMYHTQRVVLATQNIIEVSRRVLMQDPESALLPKLTAYLKEYYPEYKRMVKYPLLSKKKIVLLRLLECRKYKLAKKIFDFKASLK